MFRGKKYIWVQYHLQFQAFPGGLGMYSLWRRRDYQDQVFTGLRLS